MVYDYIPYFLEYHSHLTIMHPPLWASVFCGEKSFKKTSKLIVSCVMCGNCSISNEVFKLKHENQVVPVITTHMYII